MTDSGTSTMIESNPQSLNRYAYVTNNPLAHIDPLGLNEADPGSGVVCRSQPSTSQFEAIATTAMVLTFAVRRNTFLIIHPSKLPPTRQTAPMPRPTADEMIRRLPLPRTAVPIIATGLAKSLGLVYIRRAA